MVSKDSKSLFPDIQVIRRNYQKRSYWNVRPTLPKHYTVCQGTINLLWALQEVLLSRIIWVDLTRTQAWRQAIHNGMMVSTNKAKYYISPHFYSYLNPFTYNFLWMLYITTITFACEMTRMRILFLIFTHLS